MVSDAKKKKAAAKKKGQAIATGKGNEAVEAIEEDLKAQLENGDANGVDGIHNDTTTDRSCTGVLGSHPQSRDIHIDSFSLLFHGHELIQDTSVQLNFGRYIPDGCNRSLDRLCNQALCLSYPLSACSVNSWAGI